MTDDQMWAKEVKKLMPEIAAAAEAVASTAEDVDIAKANLKIARVANEAAVEHEHHLVAKLLAIKKGPGPGELPLDGDVMGEDAPPAYGSPEELQEAIERFGFDPRTVLDGFQWWEIVDEMLAKDKQAKKLGVKVGDLMVVALPQDDPVMEKSLRGDGGCQFIRDGVVLQAYYFGPLAQESS